MKTTYHKSRPGVALRPQLLSTYKVYKHSYQSFNKKGTMTRVSTIFSGAKTTRPACIGLLTRGTCPLYEPFWPPTPISRSGRWMVTHRYSGMLNALFPINDPVGEVPHPRPLRCFRNYRETVMRTSVLSVVRPSNSQREDTSGV